MKITLAFVFLFSFSSLYADNPVITLDAGTDTTIEVYSTFRLPVATAIDLEDGDISAAVIITGNWLLHITGDYPILFSITDDDGNKDSILWTLKVRDLDKPVVTLIGPSIIECLEVQNIPTYISSGATATDNYDYAITSKIKMSTNLDVTKIGRYYEKFWVTDSSGNTSNAVYRHIFVVYDCTPPVITLNGANNTIIWIGTPWNDPGATALDNRDGDLTNAIVTSGSVDTQVLGSYTIRYDVQDNQGHSAYITRWVFVREAPTPTITIRLNLLAHKVHTKYNPLSAISFVTDDVDGNLTEQLKVTHNVDTARVGSYDVTYSVTNSLGYSDTVRIVVQVVDVIDPIITSKNGGVVRIARNSIYEPTDYINLSDNYDHSDSLIKNLVIVFNDLDLTTNGIYSTEFQVTDSSGNISKIYKVITIVSETVSILETNSLSSLKIYPNPSFGNITVVNSGDTPIGQITLYNLLGQEVFHTKTQDAELALNLEHLPSGVYSLAVYRKNIRVVQTVILK
ncbi:MAG: hypothetical protein COA58_03220 [Bacteroidetes bacterium]|nr:MAG: hypothetical protein COA58_03220 [Bacteroidota bacterium]